ncbi:MAG: galactose oxidase-like domain-containing protein [Phycisphaerales bacterium]
MPVPDSWPHAAGRGSAVTFKPGWVLKSGGTFAGNNAQNLTSWIDMNNPSDTNGEWELLPNMVNEKERHNLVMLPDGKILAIGGKVDGEPYDIPIMAAEWFDPDPLDPHWEQLAVMVRPRGLHSTAVLLGDGRVLACGGDDHFDPDFFDTSESGEIFSPPYLFVAGGGDAPRPKIGFAPTVVTYGSDFSVILTRGSEVPVEEIDKVSFLRLGSVTHHFDQNQR